MRILTTSDLYYVSGGEDDGYSCGPSWSDDDSTKFANGMSFIVTNPEAAAASYLIQLYNAYRNPGAYQTVPYSNPMGDMQ